MAHAVAAVTAHAWDAFADMHVGGVHNEHINQQHT